MQEEVSGTQREPLSNAQALPSPPRASSRPTATPSRCPTRYSTFPKSLCPQPPTVACHDAESLCKDRCQDPSSCARAAALKERGRYKTRRKKFLIQVEVPPSFTLEKGNFWEVIFQEPVYLSARLIAGNSCSVNHLQKDHRSGRGWCCLLLQRNST